MPLFVAMDSREFRLLKMFSAGSSMDGVEKPVRSEAEGLSNEPSSVSRSTGALTKEAEECSMNCVASRMIAATLRGRDTLRWISDDIEMAIICH